ncbi:hypothetical protein IMY05_C4695000300 [Salix suchowensis]|nr:hypothetical protein IMY05_C4695000300 [Salix suchowensis]
MSVANRCWVQPIAFELLRSWALPLTPIGAGERLGSALHRCHNVGITNAHTFLLPYYFRRCNLNYSDDLTTVDYLSFNRDKMALTEDAFRAIRTSPVVTKVKHLHCIFSFPEHQFLWEIRNVYTVLVKLQHVEKIELNFAAIPNRLISRHVGRLKTLREWRCAFRTFMQTVLDKLPSSLSVLYPPEAFWMPPTESIPETNFESGFGKFSLLDRPTRWAAPRFNQRALFVGSRTSCSNSAPRTSLDVVDIARIHNESSQPYDSWSDTHNIDILPNERKRGETYAYRPYIIPDAFLPHLKNLKASLDVVLVFFGPHSTAKFGHLETIEVSEELNIPPSPDWESMARRLSRVAPRLDGKYITLDLSELQRNLFPKQPCTILSDMQIKELRLCILGVAAKSNDLVPWISSFTHLERLSIRSRDRLEYTLRSTNASLRMRCIRSIQNVCKRDS